LAGGFLLGFGGFAALIAYVGDPDFQGYLNLLAPGMTLLVPLAGIIVGYDALVTERESGAAVLTLSMPHSREALIAGNIASRTAQFVGVVGVPTALTGLGMAVTYPAFEAVRYLGFVGVTVGYGLVFVWVAAALSIASWDVLIAIAEGVLFRFRSTGPEPVAWATALTFIGPQTATEYLLGTVINAGAVPPVANEVTAWYISPVVAAVALVFWAVGPVAIGSWSFQQSDL
jgi:ABC-2 type transport system permease protein